MVDSSVESLHTGGSARESALENDATNLDFQWG